MITAGQDGAVVLWNPETGELLDVVAQFLNPVLDCGFDNIGTKCIVGKIRKVSHTKSRIVAAISTMLPYRNTSNGLRLL